MCTSTSVISTPGNRCCTLAFRLHTPTSIFVILKFKRAHLKFLVYGRKQTDRQTDRHTYIHTYIHTHVRNAVTLVWGSLRLAPIITGCSPILRVNDNTKWDRRVSSVDNHPSVGVDKVIDLYFLLRSISPVQFTVYPIPCYVPYMWKKKIMKCSCVCV